MKTLVFSVCDHYGLKIKNLLTKKKVMETKHGLKIDNFSKFRNGVLIEEKIMTSGEIISEKSSYLAGK